MKQRKKNAASYHFYIKSKNYNKKEADSLTEDKGSVTSVERERKGATQGEKVRVQTVMYKINYKNIDKI